MVFKRYDFPVSAFYADLYFFDVTKSAKKRTLVSLYYTRLNNRQQPLAIAEKIFNKIYFR